MSNLMSGRLETLKQWILESEYTVLLTGAGMSTESGLPDFRSNDGLWHGKDPQQIASTYALHNNREEFIDFYRWRIKELDNYEPHDGYHIVTRWQRQGLLHRIITQNVDGFHSKAASHGVIELHGSLKKVSCLACGEQFPSDRYLKDDGTICPKCSGFLRPNIVLFGEMLPEQAIQQAFDEAHEADLFLVFGSSLQVSPANILPLEAKQLGARFAIINLDESYMDTEADLVIRGKIGEQLALLDKKLL